jgi:hypothetical protein
LSLAMSLASGGPVFRSARAALLSIVVLLSLVPPVAAAQRPGHDFERIPL